MRIGCMFCYFYLVWFLTCPWLAEIRNSLIFISNFKQIMLPNHIFFRRYKASGIRLDSGDLAYLSIEARKVFRAVEEEFNVPGFGRMVITASNDLNEETIDALNKQVINLYRDCITIYQNDVLFSL